MDCCTQCRLRLTVASLSNYYRGKNRINTVRSYIVRPMQIGQSWAIVKNVNTKARWRRLLNLRLAPVNGDAADGNSSLLGLASLLFTRRLHCVRNERDISARFLHVNDRNCEKKKLKLLVRL